MNINPIVTHPVYDLDGQLLADAGTELSPDFMDDLCRRNTAHYDLVELLGYGNIRKDLMHQFTIPPYNVIFSQGESITTVLEVMERVSLPLPLLQAMDYFRKNDFHTYRHMLIISALSTLILHNLGPEYIDQDDKLYYIGPSHDLGKIATPLPILLKKTPLTSSELDLLHHHAVAGYVMLSHYMQDHTGLTSLIALDHHERRDGSGYPRGIQQNNLIIEVTTVCDIYDALVAQRPYRPISYDNRTAIEELTWMAQKGELSWQAVQVLVAYNRHIKPDFQDVEVSLEHRGKPPQQNMYGKLSDEEEAG